MTHPGFAMLPTQPQGGPEPRPGARRLERAPDHGWLSRRPRSGPRTTKARPTRDPVGAPRSWLATTSPAGALLDLAEFGLTFAPGNFAGAAAGRSIRSVAREHAADPATFWARRRAALADSERGYIELPGRGSIEPRKLEPHELRQAQDIVEYRGGRFVGASRRGEPGIDGYLDDTPVSLKEYTGSSLQSVLSHVSKAEKQAQRAGYTGVDVYIDAVNVPKERMLDFASKGPLRNIPTQGVVRTIHVKTADGWIIIPGDLP